MQGYIKLHRKIMCSSIWQDPEMYRLWSYCLMKASHKERSVMVEKRVVNLEPGQFITGRFKLHQEYNNGLPQKYQVKETTLWSWLKRLETIGNIDINSFNKFSVVSILNWCEYQEVLTTEQQQTDNKLTTKPQQTDTDKNVNNVKNDKNGKKENNIRLEIENFRIKFTPEQLEIIDDYLEMIRHTRTSGKIQDSVVLGMYKDWDKHPWVCVEYGLKTHTKDPKLHSKKENYTLGIIRNTTADEASMKLNGVSSTPKKKADASQFNLED